MPFSSLEGAGHPQAEAQGHAPAPRGTRGRAAGLSSPWTLGPFPAPPPARSRTSLEPVPYTAKRGEGQGPPDTAALRHESPPPARDMGQGRGAHFLYLAGLDPILSRGGFQSPIHSLPWSHQVWLGVPLSLFPSFVFVLLSSLSYMSVFPYMSLLFVSPSLLPLTSHILSSLPVSPGYLSPVHIFPGRSHWKDQTLPYSSLFPRINPHMNKIQNQVHLPIGAGTLRRSRIKLFSVSEAALLTSVCVPVSWG